MARGSIVVSLAAALVLIDIAPSVDAIRDLAVTLTFDFTHDECTLLRCFVCFTELTDTVRLMFVEVTDTDVILCGDSWSFEQLPQRVPSISAQHASRHGTSA